MYADDRNAQIVLSLLKKYNIKKIVVSPGTTNVPIARSVQIDPFFEVYSVVDERSAAYFATGLAFESGEAVVISCTGATASRNYLSGLTEAYYRNLPIIALTSQASVSDYGNFTPQVTDRTVSQNDIKRIAVHLPIIKSAKDDEAWVLSVNRALTMATMNGCGPVHINLLVDKFTCNEPALPDIPKIEYYQSEDLLGDTRSRLIQQLTGKRVGIFIGSHRKISSDENKAIEAFIDTYDVVVFYEHTSNYHGKNAALFSSVDDLKKLKDKPDIMVDIGGVVGDYFPRHLFTDGECWRVSEDGKFHQRYGNLRKQFSSSERFFFERLADNEAASTHEYYKLVSKLVETIVVPELPLSNAFISQKMAELLPKGCSLHLGILNSLRNMNFFRLDESIDSSCNVGGFGIDGAVSTLIGQSMVNKERLYFGQIGDLAFFYDMNALGIRHIGKNIRILLINNGRGVEFRLNPTINEPIGDDLDEFICAAGHFGSAKDWSESMGFEYMAARNKEEFLDKIDLFCSPDINQFNGPVLFEVFTTLKDEQEAVKMIRSANTPVNLTSNTKDFARRIVPKKAQNAIRKIIK